jgi:hypothetical protein
MKARDRQGNTFPNALPAFSVNDEDEWFKLVSLVGQWRYGPREGEVGTTARLTGWPLGGEADYRRHTRSDTRASQCIRAAHQYRCT